jgi:hypothetical protein
VNTKDKFCAFLFVFNLKHQGRNERYEQLQSLVQEGLSKK